MIVKAKNKDHLKMLIKLNINRFGNECNLNYIDVSNITDMSNIFQYSNFNGKIDQWDVSNVENMFSMFAYSQFNKDISNWNVSNVTDMYCMFYNTPLQQYNNLPHWYKNR